MKTMTYDITDLIAKSLTGQMNASETKFLSDWLSESEKNLQEYTEIARLFTQEKHPPRPEMEAELSRLESSLKPDPVKKTSNRSVYSYWAVAASLLLAFTAGLFFYRNYSVDTLSAKNGNELLLEDGSEILLYGDAQVKIPVPFSRQVELTGAAYFIIQKDPEHPFVVLTSNAKIKVLGTRFTVRSQDKFTHLTVTEGKVALNPATGDTASAQILTSGMSGSISDQNVDRPDLEKTSSDVIQWSGNKLEFRKLPLITLMKEISLHYNVIISIKNEDIKSQTVSGIYENQSEEIIIQSVCSALNLQYQKDGKVYTIFQP